MQQPKLKKTFTIPVAANAKRVGLEVMQQFADKHILGISARFYDTAGNRQSVLGATLLQASVYAKAFLTLKKSASEIISRFPLENLSQDLYISGGLGYMPVNMETGFSYAESTIEIPGGANASGDLEITLHYSDIEHPATKSTRK